VEMACRELSDTVVSLMSKFKAAGSLLESGFAVEFALLDFGGGLARKAGGTRQVGRASVRSTPLATFLDGLAGSLPKDGERTHAFGMAAISEVRMHAIITTDSHTVALHTSCSDAIEHNYIFGCFDGDEFDQIRNRRRMLWVEGILQRRGFDIGHADSYVTFWKYARTAYETKAGLTMLGGMIGRMIRGGPAGRTGTPVETEIDAFLEHDAHSDNHAGRC